MEKAFDFLSSHKDVGVSLHFDTPSEPLFIPLLPFFKIRSILH